MIVRPVTDPKLLKLPGTARLVTQNMTELSEGISVFEHRQSASLCTIKR